MNTTPIDVDLPGRRTDSALAQVFASLRPAIVLLIALSVVTGLGYPLVVTGLAQATMPRQADGSLIERDGVVVGSALIGQSFADPKHLWGRPSATSPMPNNAAASGGSNLGPTNPALMEAVRARADRLRAADPGRRATVPVELVTASASGLDPHLSPAAADWQVPRIAAARGLEEAEVRAIVARRTERPWPAFLGEPVVDVLGVNLDLDATGR